MEHDEQMISFVWNVSKYRFDEKRTKGENLLVNSIVFFWSSKPSINPFGRKRSPKRTEFLDFFEKIKKIFIFFIFREKTKTQVLVKYLESPQKNFQPFPIISWV